jgi:hypothetical protein
VTSFDERPVAIGGIASKLRLLRAPLLIAAAGLILSWPAFYNGYPLLWYDSGGYLIAGWEHAYQPPMRSPFYGLAILPLLALNSEWPIVFAQAGIAAAMIFLTLRVAWGGLRAGSYLLLVLLLALLTTLPWHSSTIMADLPAALLPLGVFMLAFGRDRLTGWEVAFVFAVTCLSCMVHYSHLPLMAALTVIALAIDLMERRPRGGILSGLGLCLAVILITAAAHIAVQLKAHDRLAIAPDSSVFLLARLIEDGPAKDFLAAHCAEANFALCAYVADMPMTTTYFLWDGDGPVSRLGGFGAVSQEAKIIVGGTLREQPLRIAMLSLRHTLKQLESFDTHGYLRQFSSPVRGWQQYADIMKDNLAGEYEDFTGSRQSTGRLGRWVFSLLTPTVAISAVLLAVLALTGLCRGGAFRGDLGLRALFWLVLGTEIANAAICGAFSEPSSRYQSRVVWLLPFLLLVVAMPLIGARIAGRRRAMLA